MVAVEPEIEARERARARRKPPESLDAWELLQRGLSRLHRANKTDRTEAIRLFGEAITLDPEFVAAHAHLAYAFSSSVPLGYAEDTAKALAGRRFDRLGRGVASPVRKAQMFTNVEVSGRSGHCHMLPYFFQLNKRFRFNSPK